MPSPEDFAPYTSIVIAMQKDSRLAGHLTVEAEVTGQWAVHVTFGKTVLREPYSVTHIVSGACVRPDITLEAARLLAAQLHESVPAFDTTEGPAWLRAKDAIKEVVYGQIAA